jgi:hypothetical protein
MSRHARQPDSSVLSTESSTGSSESRHVTHHDHGDRPHVLAIVFGLLDAHVSHIDYFDTIGGDEVVRMYRRRHALRHGPDDRPGVTTTRR